MKDVVVSSAERALAFNLGSDARLRGLGLRGNPYVDKSLREWWRLGWWHVAEWWGKESRRPVRPLPPLVGSD